MIRSRTAALAALPLLLAASARAQTGELPRRHAPQPTRADITPALKIPEQILLIAQDDVVRQLAKTSRECGFGNGIVRW